MIFFLGNQSSDWVGIGTNGQRVLLRKMGPVPLCHPCPSDKAGRIQHEHVCMFAYYGLVWKYGIPKPHALFIVIFPMKKQWFAFHCTGFRSKITGRSWTHLPHVGHISHHIVILSTLYIAVINYIPVIVSLIHCNPCSNPQLIVFASYVTI